MKWAIVLTACASLAWGQDVKRPRITGVVHIGLMAHEVNQSRSFYTDLLGWQEPYSLKSPDITFFKINDHQYVELVPETRPATDRLTHIALETDDAAGLLKYLASRGVKVPERAEKGRLGNLSFSVTDPDGHSVEFVQYLADGLSMREKGKFMDANRAPDHMSHVGIIVYSLEPAMKFYRDILGCQEAWRGSGNAKFLSWVNMRVPEGEDWVEFMLYDEFPSLKQLGVLHHIGLVAPDVAAATAVIEARPARRTYTGAWEYRGTTRHTLQVYDPDGSRTEIMEPGVSRESSTVPPIR
jgi:catechol 2,3-dioxygenase-like lactoylglutathione lyase family enzyme